jgi:hypothetical protein
MDKNAIHLQGYVHALADVCRRGYPGVAVDILNASEITLGDLETAGADASDLEELREAVSPGVRVKR